MKSIFGKIWALYTMIIFLLIFIIIFPFHLISILFFRKSGLRLRIWVSNKVYARIFFFFIFIRIKVSGQEYLEEDQPYIIISNHVSALDFMINTMTFPGIYQYLIKKELTKIPFVGYVLDNLAVAVERGNRDSTSSGLKKLTETLENGLSVFLYAEGTRNKTKDLLQPFKNGAFKMAIETQTPIAMQTIVNIEDVAPSTSVGKFYPGTVQVVWSKPFETKGLTMDDLEELKLRCWNEMKGLLLEYKKEVLT